jgi:hypothetical protein
LTALAPSYTDTYRYHNHIYAHTSTLPSNSRQTSQSLLKTEREWREEKREQEEGPSDEFKKVVQAGLKDFEQDLCNTMERFSELAMASIRKKFIADDDSSGIFLVAARGVPDTSV